MVWRLSEQINFGSILPKWMRKAGKMEETLITSIGCKLKSDLCKR